jgi:primosomal protein N' (replication factor Y)
LNPTLPNTAVVANKVLVRVAISVPIRQCFDYLLPDDYAVTPQIGMRVEVPFGSSNKIGLIDSVSDDFSEINIEKIKTVSRILDEQPLVNQTLVSLQQWLCRYYHAPTGEVWQTMLPKALLKGEKAELSRTSRWLITEQGKQAIEAGEIPKSAVKQRQVLNQLSQQPQGIAHDKLKDFGFNYPHMKTLAGKKWVERDYTTESIISDSGDNHSLVNHNLNITLNSEQQEAIDKVASSFEKYQAFLLFGVTASGKTEVYLQLIEQLVKQGKQALVLVPEIGLTPQTLKRFQDRFNLDIVLLHSNMTDKQRLQSWLKARNGSAKIIIGTRSALFTPLKNPGIIIIDEEHDLSFRQQQGFRYSARDVAMVRANLENIPIVLGSASPSLESLYNVEKEKITCLKLVTKAKSQHDLNYEIIDLKKQPTQQGLSNQLVQIIKKHLAAKGQVLLFLNRRGYSPVLLCNNCGWSPECKRCDIHYTYHHQSQSLQCHHCGAHKKITHQCGNCGSQQMVPIGLGTERLQETIQTLFPDAKCARIDRDTTQKKSAMDDFVKATKAGEIDILIGTQMLAKGHHFPKLTLVGLVDIDGALYSADFRAPEYAAQLITQVSGRAGRADKPGQVVIQTHHPEHPMLHQVIHSGYDVFAKAVIQERVEAELPPHHFVAVFQAESPEINNTKQFLMDAKQVLRQKNQWSIELLGPAPAIHTKKAGKFRYQLFIQSELRRDLHQLLEESVKEIEKLKSAKRVRWRVEVDPIGD